MRIILQKLKGLKKLAYRTHFYCEDTWYSCPKHEAGCANDAYKKDECTCGADEHNAEVDALYTSLKDSLDELT